MTQQLEVNGAAPIGIGHSNGVEHLYTSPPSQQREPPLRMFISYKKKDKDAAVSIKQQLRKFSAGNIDVFVSDDEPPAHQWRELILKHLSEAHILVFLYTDPKSQWDWCLYETGYFDARQSPAELDRRLYVLHRREDSPSGPFLGLNTVPIDTSDNPDDTDLKAFFEIVFERATSPAVNPHWNEGGCEALVMAFRAPFRRSEEVVPPQENHEYVRRLTFRLKTGPETEASLNEGRIPADTMVSGDPKSFELFGFGTEKARPWEELENSWQRKSPPAPQSADGTTDTDPRTLWVENLAQKMLAAIKEETFRDGLPLFFCPFFPSRAEALFRPSLASFAVYPDAYEFDVVFVDVPLELAAASKGPLTTVGILLKLAHMFRFGWIEPTARAVDPQQPARIPEVAREMWRRLHSIMAESFIQGIYTEQEVLLAFEEDSALQTEIRQSLELWKNTVAPALVKSVKDKDTNGLLDALKKASKINWQFHRACAQRYLELVDHHYTECAGPFAVV